MTMTTIVIFGGGGKVARHFARIASPSHTVLSVLRDSTHARDLASLGASPVILSLESTPLPSLVDFLRGAAPSAVIFAAGAGGKGGPERTRAVDYEGALKVYDACEAAGVRRLLLVSAVDVRDRSKPVPKHYNEHSIKTSDHMWSAIGTYMQAKYDSEHELHTRSGLDYTVVRPGGLTDEPSGGVEIGVTQIGKTSRETVARALLACALDPRTIGLTLDVMDGDGEMTDEIEKAVKGHLDAWTG